MPIKCLKAVNIYPNTVLCFIEILKIWLPLKGLLILKSKKAHIKKLVTPKWVSDMFSSLFYLHQCSLIFQFELCTFLPSQHLYFVWVGVCVIILAIEYKLLIWDKKTYQWLQYDQDWWAPKCVDRYLCLYTYISIMFTVLKKMIGNWFRELFHISQANVWVSRHSNSSFSLWKLTSKDNARKTHADAYLKYKLLTMLSFLTCSVNMHINDHVKYNILSTPTNTK